jgi:Cysteine rich repeat
MVRCLVLVAAVLAVSIVARAAETPFGTHTAAEEKACRGDAHRFCKEELADEFRTASCLQEHREKVSRACRDVLEGHGM